MFDLNTIVLHWCGVVFHVHASDQVGIALSCGLSFSFFLYLLLCSIWIFYCLWIVYATLILLFFFLFFFFWVLSICLFVLGMLNVDGCMCPVLCSTYCAISIGEFCGRNVCFLAFSRHCMHLIFSGCVICEYAIRTLLQKLNWEVIPKVFIIDPFVDVCEVSNVAFCCFASQLSR